MKLITINGKSLTLEQIASFLQGKVTINVAQEAVIRLTNSRRYIEAKLASHLPFYGINTGFGGLAGKRIPDNDLNALQENLIVSHAAGTGPAFPESTVRLIMLLRANVLALGYSGIKPETLQLLVDVANKGIVPVIPEQGSVGASGDLSPLSHVALTLIGKGDVYYRRKLMPARQALSMVGLKPIKLAPKEGIALINGTQAMTAVAARTLLEAQDLLKLADIIGALSIEGDQASIRPFDERLHLLRPQPGQVATASNVRKLLSDSQIIVGHAKCKRVQDPYSFRCIPQVHGAIKDSIRHCKNVVEKELNSCTDNPLVFYEDDEIISGGNFHGEPLAIAMDLLSIAMAELASISERRTAILLAPLEGEIPRKYLVARPGLNSGLAPVQVTMASLVSENKTLAHPASVDSIPTFAGQEDHVSMGLWAARKAAKIVENAQKVLSMEMLAAAQAIDLQNKLKKKKNSCGLGTRRAYELIREEIDYLDGDRLIYPDLKKSLDLLKSKAIIKAVESVIGTLRV